MSQTSNVLFQLENVRYRDVLTIEQFVIPAGQITCLIGSSGGGKTTLLRLLAKLISPDSGTITFANTLLSERDSVTHRREVAMLSQQPILFPGTVADNLRVGLKIEGKEATDEALYDVLKTVRLKQALDADVEHLSGGEAQRLALARILLLDRPVILLDEPSSALDEATERLIIETVVSTVREQGKTLVMATHSTDEARRHADVIVQLENGRLKGREDHA